MTISFEGGPADGDELHGLAARVVGDWGPPFVCASIDGRHEHYVRVAEGRYRHAGACRRLAEGGRHPGCGHNHETEW